MNKSGEAAGDLTFSMPGDRKGGPVPNLGFDKDHVLSDAESLSAPPDNKVTLHTYIHLTNSDSEK